MKKTNIIIISALLLIISLLIISCNIFEWSSELNLNNPYDLVRAGDSALNDEEWTKAKEHFSKAITLFESTHNLINDKDNENYFYFLLYYSKAYRGLGTAYLQEILTIELLIDIIGQFSKPEMQDGTANANYDDILDYLLSETYPDEEERKEKINELYLGIIARYQSDFDYDNDSKNDYYYALDEEQRDLEISEKRGAATECFDKAEALAHKGYLEGKERLSQGENFTDDEQQAYDRIKEVSMNSAFDSILGFVLSTVLLGMDSSFDFEAVPQEGGMETEGDYFVILPDYTYSSRLEEEIEILIGDGASGITGDYNPATMTEQEKDELLAEIDSLLVILKGIKRFSNALYTSITRLFDVYLRFYSLLETLDLSDEQQALIDEYIVYFINNSNKECVGCVLPSGSGTNPANCENLYCSLIGIHKEIDQTITAATGMLIMIKFALVVGENWLDYFNDLYDDINDGNIDFDDEDAQTIVDLFSDENCVDPVTNEVDIDRPGCTLVMGDEANDLQDGAFDDVEDELNQAVTVTDSSDSDDFHLPGEPDLSTMEPATNWKVLQIISQCQINPLHDDCRYLDDLPN